MTLSGYGISVRIDRGHLVVEDGIGTARRRARFARVNHGLRRLTVIGSDGSVSLAALRWLADQKASFAMLDRDGTVLLTTGPAGPRIARLRRAQGLALHSECGLAIARDLIDRKLAEQQQTVRASFSRDDVATFIDQQRAEVSSAGDLTALRVLESQAAHAYWSCWRTLPVLFPNVDLSGIPSHWRTFGARVSPLTGSPRLSVNPPNAMLNYLYAVLESEASIAATAVGLDPGLGVMHLDADARDSLACDLMEPVRPLVDAFVLNWLRRQPLRREWFFEQRDGNCRLMAVFAEQLAQSAATWARAVGPVAERVAKWLWMSRHSRAPRSLPTPLTQQHRRNAKLGKVVVASQPEPPSPLSLCIDCGRSIPSTAARCAQCQLRKLPDHMRTIAVKGRTLAQTPAAQRRRSVARKQHLSAQASWKPESQPTWLTAAFYESRVYPRLKNVGASKLASAMGVSAAYVYDIRAGKYRPHPRHWLILARMVGVEDGQGDTRTTAIDSR